MADQTAKEPQAAGWKKDPTGRHYARYWDGAQWTEHVASAEKVKAVDPLPPAPEPSIFPDAPPPPPPPRTVAPPAAPTPTYRGPAPTAPGYVPPAGGKRSKDGGVNVWKIALGVTLGMFLFMGVCVALVAGRANKAAKDIATQSTGGTTPGTSPAGTAPAAKTTYKIGDTAKTGDFEATVYGVKDPQPTNQFDKPAAGNRYVGVDVQIANKGAQQQTFSSFIGFHLVDSANRQYDLKITTVDPKAPEGQIPAGGAVRGIAVFEVPEATTGLRLRVQGGFTASGAFFTLS
jgi:hypothetical protein